MNHLPVIIGLLLRASLARAGKWIIGGCSYSRESNLAALQNLGVHIQASLQILALDLELGLREVVLALRNGTKLIVAQGILIFSHILSLHLQAVDVVRSRPRFQSLALDFELVVPHDRALPPRDIQLPFGRQSPHAGRGS
jgi:hypothetical protein